MATTIISTEVKGNHTVYMVETGIQNPITNLPDTCLFRVVVTEVCPGDTECLTTATRCVQSPEGLKAPATAQNRARSYAKRAHLKGMA